MMRSGLMGLRGRVAAGAARRVNVLGANARGFHASGPARKEEEPLPPSWIEQYQLDEPSRFVPLTLGGFGLATATGLYHIDAESQLLVLWVLFTGTIYSRGGPLIAEFFDSQAEEILKEHNALEDEEINAVKEVLDVHKKQIAVSDDINELFAAQNELMSSLVASAQGKLKREIRTEFDKRLRALAKMEADATDAVRTDLVEAATKYVRQSYGPNGDANLKSSALDAALGVLSNPEGAKKDAAVRNLYSQYIKDFSAKAAAASGSEIELTKEQIQEVQELVESVARRDGLNLDGFKVSPTAVAP